MKPFTNLAFEQIKVFKPQSLCVQITKLIINPTLFNHPFHEYMVQHHHFLNQYFINHHYNSQSQKVIRGKINEYLILFYFQHQGISNLYPQAYLFFIPDIKFDLVLFTKTKRIIAFNFKTCLRDRYKQAVVEAQQLKKLDTRFEFYLLTNNTVEAQRLNKKINQGKILGINQVINLFSPRANHFLHTLRINQFIPFPDINIIKKAKRS
ncbi:hypothetical protein [Candidatus Phytoplasma citri]|uniref:Uncharacterized protein n=1 Tax=Candidatus Phytoplasma citri TaxID=180978 RepID=A0A1S9M680_9MOLU|nr:hypothetical protein [Candidatus Phytoplasma aurantifolia]MDO8060080.1 hypothetical protein [Candidatus Phytoplasma aurantifolia]MDO8078932.1 hypothetical protein [Candidatus Phytoplasma aurantifolia]OOP60593.1 hypothetical protein B2G44_00065 [Candidatus Phytoplasma aurantifolia]